MDQVKLFRGSAKSFMSRWLFLAGWAACGSSALAYGADPAKTTSSSATSSGTAPSQGTNAATTGGTDRGSEGAAKAERPVKPDGAVKADAPVKQPSAGGGTLVEIKTTEGTFKIELADKEAPLTVKNFLTYVDDKFYDGLVFHRVIKDFMIQGGGYSVVSDRLVEKPTKAPIANEAKNGLKNTRGSIAMARTQDPNSATAQFFINHVNNNNLDYPSFDGHGYAVFGKVTEGLDVVDKIASVKTGVKGGMPDVPLTDVKIISIQMVKPASH